MSVHGIDVSIWQHGVDWKAVKASGISFAFARIADGAKLDEVFWQNWAGLREAGLVRGVYLFFRPGESAEEQARLVLSSLAFEPGDLPPALDVEAHGNLPAKAVEASVRRWVRIVRDAIGRDPILYTGPWFWDTFVKGPADVSAASTPS